MRILRPLRDRDFALLWAGLTISLLGDGIYLVAIAWQVYDLSNTPSALALVGLAWSIGLAAFLLGGGVVSDRFDRRRVMVFADLVRAVALLAIGVLSVSGRLELWHLIALVIVYAGGEAFFGPALGALVPDILRERQLVEANALEQFMRQTFRRLVGPALGGGVVAWVGPGDAFLIDAATFVASAIAIGLIRTRSRGAPASTGSLRREMAEGIAFVRSQRWIWVTVLVSSVALLLFYGPMEVLLPYLIRNELGGGAGVFGLVLAADGIGAIVASLWLSQRGMPRRYLTVTYIAWGLATLPVAGYALATASWQLMALSAIHGALIALGLVIWGTLLQVRVPPEMRGRARSVDWFASIAFAPLSFALTAPVAGLLGARTTLVLAGVVPALTTLVLFLAFRLQRDETPLPAPRGHLAEEPAAA
ncbi:MAG: MFS transporter [Solirubrobacteraceae bacterium]|nr:MFS transporter [Solirubrobacteraceae bacterium]